MGVAVFSLNDEFLLELKCLLCLILFLALIIAEFFILARQIFIKCILSYIDL
jgi:hypothetical protein